MIFGLFEQSDGEGKRKKTSGLRDDNCDSKADMDINSAKTVDKNTQPSDTPKQDYIHVRARRGQATDSHSLAERVITSNLSNSNSLVIILFSRFTADISHS